MKKLYQSLKRQDGFTLVELMVVVAIIGLLSAVAIPNFKKYQAKSKMSEAKLQLSAIYTAETAFFSDFNMYAMCLRYMGFDPFAERNSRYYGVGFPDNAAAARNAAAHTSAVNSGMQSADCPAAATAVEAADATTPSVTYFPAFKGVGGAMISTMAIGAAAGASTIGDQSSAPAMIFTAVANGIISGDFANTGGTDSSALSINEVKVITTVRQGF